MILWLCLFVTLLKVLCVFAFSVSCWRASFYISCSLGLVLLNSLSICLYEKVFLFHILMIIFTDRILWGESFSLSEFWECYSTPSWIVGFLLWNLLVVLWVFHEGYHPAFSVSASKLFFVNDFWQLQYHVSWGRSLCTEVN